MQLYIKCLTGRGFTIDIESLATITALKSKIHAKEGFPVEDQRLIFAGKELEDGKVISDYNIQKSAMLHIVIRQRGG
mgnify:FL=1